MDRVGSNAISGYIRDCANGKRSKCSKFSSDFFVGAKTSSIFIALAFVEARVFVFFFVFFLAIGKNHH